MSAGPGRPSRPARVDTDPRLRRRRVGVARQRKRRLITALAAVVAVAIAVWLLVWSPLLRVSDVVVEGARHTPETDVIEAAGLTNDDHLLFLASEAIATRVETLPWVRAADIDRILPGRVRVTIVERRAALILASGEERWTLDVTGRVLDSGEVVRGLPILSAAHETGIRPGLTLQNEAARDALRAWRRLPAPIRKQVRGIVAPTLERITFLLIDTTQIRYGAAEQMRAKNAVLVALLARLEAEGSRAVYVDVRVPANPAVRPVGAATEPATTAPPTPVPTPTPTGTD